MTKRSLSLNFKTTITIQEKLNASLNEKDTALEISRIYNQLEKCVDLVKEFSFKASIDK